MRKSTQKTTQSKAASQEAAHPEPASGTFPVAAAPAPTPAPPRKNRDQELLAVAVGDGGDRPVEIVAFGLQRVASEIRLLEVACYSEDFWEDLGGEGLKAVLRGIGARVSVLAEIAEREAERQEREELAQKAAAPAPTPGATP